MLSVNVININYGKIKIKLKIIQVVCQITCCLKAYILLLLINLFVCLIKQVYSLPIQPSFLKKTFLPKGAISGEVTNPIHGSSITLQAREHMLGTAPSHQPHLPVGLHSSPLSWTAL